MKKETAVLFSFVLVCSLGLTRFPARARMASGSEEAPAAMQLLPAPPPPREMVPAEIRAAFEGGMTIDEFVERTGGIPQALKPALVEKQATMVIELEQPPLAVYVADRRATGQLAIQAAERTAYVETLKRVQRDVESRLLALEASVTIISRYTAAYNGFLARVPLDRLDEIRDLPEVKAIHRAPEHRPALGTSVPLIGAPQVWEDLGYRGEGIAIAVIDSGIDYTHANFGGSGDPADFQANNPDVVEAGTFPTTKVITGTDFAGTDYDASGESGSTVPSPDDDPLDEMFHGTHVASIAAGIQAGEVMTGVAPAANLIALKVFGEAGSTNLTVDAIDWATAHFLAHGYPQVINMSLGSFYGPADPNDPSVAATDNASAAGIVVVGAAGNMGDTSYVLDSPGSADTAISAAASEDGVSVVDGFEVITPTDIAGVQPGLQSVLYDWTSAELPITGTLVYPEDQPTGCEPFSVSNTELISGNVVLLDWTEPSCGGSTARTGNAVDAGATGVLIADESSGFDLLISGSDQVPAYSTPYEVGESLKAALGTDAVRVVMTNAHEKQLEFVEGTFVDAVATFSSRGPRGFDSRLKPDLTAPGGSIFAAEIGTGTGGVSYGGTSMSSPHVAGVAALVRQAHPDWTPEQVKAALMNTAVDLVSGFKIPRQGAGRIDAGKAITTPVVAIADENLVSASWGFAITGQDEEVLRKDVTLWNRDLVTHTFTVSAALQTGIVTDTASITEAVTVETSDDTVVVPGNGMSATVGITVTIDATAFPSAFGNLEEVYGFVTFDSQTIASHRLRVPFYVVPRPYSELAVVSSNSTITNPAALTLEATLEHSGPISSSLRAYPAMLQDPNELGQLDPGDVRLLGMDYGGEDADYGDLVAVAINSYGPWHTPQPYFAEFDLYLDVDEDGLDDFAVFNWNVGSLVEGDPTDAWVVVQLDLVTEEVGLASPFLINTDYNANIMEWHLPAEWNGLGRGDTTFDYELLGWDYLDNYRGTDGIPDTTAAGSFDYGRPPMASMVTGVPGPANPTVVMTTTIVDFGGYLYSRPIGTMVIDYSGDPRGAATDQYQAYFLPGPVGVRVYLPTVLR